MSVTENKAIVQRLVEEGWNGRRLEVFDALLAPNLANHDPNRPEVTDLNGLKQWAQAIWSAVPDFVVQITDQIGEEDRVAKSWVGRGTQTGVLMGIPATGKRVEFSGTTVYQLSGAKITNIRWSYDMLGMLQQIGVVPVMGQAPA